MPEQREDIEAVHVFRIKRRPKLVLLVTCPIVCTAALVMTWLQIGGRIKLNYFDVVLLWGMVLFGLHAYFGRGHLVNSAECGRV